MFEADRVGEGGEFVGELAEGLRLVSVWLMGFVVWDLGDEKGGLCSQCLL